MKWRGRGVDSTFPTRALAPILLGGAAMIAPAPPSPIRLAAPAAPPVARVVPRSWPWRAWLALIALPVALLATLTVRFGVDGPFGDQWMAISPLFEKHAAGALSAADFFAQHNEHRPLVPKLVFFVVGLLTHWNVRVENAMTLLVLVGVAANLWQMLRVSGWRDTSAARGVFFLMVLLLFTTSQHENLLWGFQFHFVLAILFFSAICWLAPTLRAPWNFVATMALSAAATFSVASGCVCWALAAPLLWHATTPRRAGKWWALYAITGGATVAAYFWNFARPAELPSLLGVLQAPARTARYFCAYLGGPFSGGTAMDAAAVASVIGAVLSLAIGAAAARTWRERHRADFLQRALPWLTLAAFGLANAAMSTVGRSGFGVGQALASRYTTYAVLVPIALLPLGRLVCGRRRGAAWLLAIALASTLLFLQVLTCMGKAGEWSVWRRVLLMEKAHAQTLAIVPDATLRPVTLDAMRPGVPAMAALNFLRPHPLTSTAIGEIADARSPGGASYGALEQVREEAATLVLIGWAILPAHGEAAHAVLLTADDARGEPRIFALVAVGVERTGIAQRLANPACVPSGWAVEIPRGKLPPGAGAIKAWAFDVEQRRAWRIAGEHQPAR